MVTFSKKPTATLKTSMGDLPLALLPDRAPNTCENFVKLAYQGFYDGLTFHRILSSFMIQGGCPKGNGTGGPGYTIRPEFNDTPHVRGTVSMARNNDPQSAGSQFFICLADARYLDHKYSAFAEVGDGDEVLTKIEEVPVEVENRFKEKSQPQFPVYINSIILDGVEVDESDLPQPEQPKEAPKQNESSEKENESGSEVSAENVGAEEGEDAAEGNEAKAAKKSKKPSARRKPSRKKKDSTQSN